MLSSLLRQKKTDKFRYQPLYYNEKKERREGRGGIKFRKTLYNNPNNSIKGKMGAQSHFHSDKMNKEARYRKMGLMMLLFGLVTYCFVTATFTIISMFLLLILMVLFIREVNRV